MSNHNHHHHHRHNHQWQGGGGGNNTTTTTNTNNSATNSIGGGAGPCGACKYLRRKCVVGCVFAPYFDGEQGTAHFAAVHKVFGASNASKLLLRIPSHKRLDAVFTLCYEALSRLRDPVYGCVSHIFSLHQQVLNMQAELAFVQARLSTLQRQPETFSLDNHTTIPNCTILDNHIPPPPPSSTSTTSVADSMPIFDDNLHSQLTPMTTTAATTTTITTEVAELASFCNVTDNAQDGMLIEDGDLQTLTREFVSKYLSGVKFKAEPH